MALVEISRSDRIATVTFNRPEALNALNGEVLRAFRAAIREIASQKDIAVVIVTGAGEKAFIAGADISEMKPMNEAQAREFAATGQGILFELESMPQITIAAVNGFALGGGCEFAMGCDLIYASEKAKFGQPEVGLGITPGFGGTQRLWKLVGPMKAREMVYTGGMIDALEAERIGLVAKVFPPNELIPKVTEIAKTIASKGPEAVRRSKLAFREGMNADLKRGCEVEKEAFAKCFAHPDQKEGMGAFLEKRKPNWKE
ncbi:MAG: enoyl-CoA hydratase-related protein [Pseudomonadota bacterium]